MKQFLKYTGIGILSAGVEYLAYVSIIFLMKESRYAPYFGVAAGFIVSVLFSYLCNQRWVFRCEDGERRGFFRSLFKTYVMYLGTGIFLKEALTWVFIEKLAVSKFIAPPIIVVMIYPINFLLSKYWAYRTEKKDDANSDM